MGLQINFKGSILDLPHAQAGKNLHETLYKFDALDEIIKIDKGEISISPFLYGHIHNLALYEVMNTKIVPYIHSYEFSCTLLDGVERQTGRYKYKTAAGRVFLNTEGKTSVCIGGSSLEDLKVLAQKIEDGEIWPNKIPQKEHIPAFKFYRKTYGVPTLLFAVGVLVAWLTLAVMHEETYLFNKQIHDTGSIAMVQSAWGIVLACLAGGRWSYIFSKDIRPVERKVLGALVFAGLLWFTGCFYYMMFTN